MDKDYKNFVERMGSFDMEIDTDLENLKTDEIKHYGILGMKWGVRRYQNKDGSLTKAGKKKQLEEESMSEDHKRKNELRNKKISEMSNTELRFLNERLQLERQYDSMNPSKVTRGKKFVSDLFVNAAKQKATHYIANTVYSMETLDGVSNLMLGRQWNGRKR